MSKEEMSRSILLTAFRGSAAQELLKYAEGFDTLLLPNDKMKDSERLKAVLKKKRFDYVFSFGQRPLIKDKVHIETTAMLDSNVIETRFDCEKLKCQFEQQGIAAKLSHNAGTSYCNSLYYNGLCNLSDYEPRTHMVFVHIPFLKNIKKPELFFKSIITVIQQNKS